MNCLKGKIVSQNMLFKYFQPFYKEVSKSFPQYNCFNVKWKLNRIVRTFDFESHKSDPEYVAIWSHDCTDLFILKPVESD